MPIIGIVMIALGVLLFILGGIINLINELAYRRYTSHSSSSYANESYREPDDTYQESEEEASPDWYTISQSDFEAIVHKCAKRIKRIESVEVDGCFVNLSIESQSGITTWDAQIMFDLSASANFIGDYTVFSDNEDSNIPESIGGRIKKAIREKVGVE